MFKHCCLKVVSILTNVSQHSQNIVAMLGFWSKYNVSTTFTQHCLNFVSTLVNVSQHCDNVGAILVFWSIYNVDATFAQHCLNVHATLQGCLKAFINERCHNIGAFPGMCCMCPRERFCFISITFYSFRLKVVDPGGGTLAMPPPFTTSKMTTF